MKLKHENVRAWLATSECDLFVVVRWKMKDLCTDVNRLLNSSPLARFQHSSSFAADNRLHWSEFIHWLFYPVATFMERSSSFSATDTPSSILLTWPIFDLMHNSLSFLLVSALLTLPCFDLPAAFRQYPSHLQRIHLHVICSLPPTSL